MVHADSALVPSTIRTKRELYAHLQTSLASLLQDQTAWVSNLANASSLLHAALNDWRSRPQHRGDQADSSGAARGSTSIDAEDPTAGKSLNWTGFYLLSGLFPSPRPALLTKGGRRVPTLVLGPFHGLPACQAIASVPGKGVCADGSAVLPPRTVRVARTDEYPGHIACDSMSKSELVIPLVVPLSSLSETRRALVLRASSFRDQTMPKEEETEQDDLTAWSGRLAADDAAGENGDADVIVGVLDIDCVDENGFDEVDQEGLEECVRIIVKSCAW